MELKQIVEGCIKEDEVFQKLLYERYKGKLMGVCLRYCNSHEQAQDSLQESFVSIFTSIRSFKGTGSFEGWMTRVTINTTIRHSQKWEYKKVDTEINSVDFQVDDIDPIQKMSYDELLGLVQNLPNGYRVIFNMYVIDGYTHKEIAKCLNISIGTSKSQLARAKRTLISWIKKNRSVEI